MTSQTAKLRTKLTQTAKLRIKQTTYSSLAIVPPNAVLHPQRVTAGPRFPNYNDYRATRLSSGGGEMHEATVQTTYVALRRRSRPPPTPLSSAPLVEVQWPARPPRLHRLPSCPFFVPTRLRSTTTFATSHPRLPTLLLSRAKYSHVPVSRLSP